VLVDFLVAFFSDFLVLPFRVYLIYKLFPFSHTATNTAGVIIYYYNRYEHPVSRLRCPDVYKHLNLLRCGRTISRLRYVQSSIFVEMCGHTPVSSHDFATANKEEEHSFSG
jgi:hypothetical protein